MHLKHTGTLTHICAQTHTHTHARTQACTHAHTHAYTHKVSVGVDGVDEGHGRTGRRDKKEFAGGTLKSREQYTDFQGSLE